MLQWLVANSKINISSLASCSKGPSYQPMMSATSHNWENEDTLTPALQGHFFCAVPKQQLSPLPHPLLPPTRTSKPCCVQARIPLTLSRWYLTYAGHGAIINSHFIRSCIGAKTWPNLIKINNSHIYRLHGMRFQWLIRDACVNAHSFQTWHAREVVAFTLAKRSMFKGNLCWGTVC